MPVSLVTAHHEGGGAPRDDLAAPGTKGYTVGIGVTRFTLFRPPSTSFATLNFNHVSVDVLYSGDRDVFPITANDIALTRAAFATMRAAAWVVDSPFVRPHRESPGSNTICPGNRCAYPDPQHGFPAGDALTWMAIVNACHKEAPPMPDPAPPEFWPPLNVVSMCAFHHPTLGIAAVAIDGDGHVFCKPSNAYMGGVFDEHTGKPKSYWGTRKGSHVEAAKTEPGYVIESTSKQFYGPHF